MLEIENTVTNEESLRWAHQQMSTTKDMLMSESEYMTIGTTKTKKQRENPRTVGQVPKM